MHWRTSEIRRFKSLLRATSAPLSFPDLESFSRAVLDPLLEMMDGHGGQLYITDPRLRRKPVFLHHTYDSEFTTEYRKRFFKESPLHKILRRGAAEKGAFDVASVLEYERLERTSFYQEFLRKRDIHHMAGFALRIPRTSAMVMLGVQRRKTQTQFTEEEIEFLDMLISPTLGAVRTLLLANGERQKLETAFAAMPVGVLVLDWDGKFVYQNEYLENLLAAEPLSESDREAVLLCAQELKRGYESASETIDSSGVPVLFVGADRDILVRLSVLSEGLVDNRRHFLVIFEPRGPVPAGLTNDALRAKHGLTERESQVALQCMNGKTNREIGEALGIASETVKHHLKQIFHKLGISRRSQLVRVLR